MKRFMAVLVLASTLFFSSTVQAAQVSIYANQIWINTGVVLTQTDLLAVSNPAGTWSWGVGQCGPAGDYWTLNRYDQWIPNGLSSQLIGYVGSADLSAWPRSISQGDPGLFEIGSASISATGLQGTLWLGCNDAYFNPGWANDNSGFVTADITVNGREPVPEPLSCMLLGSGMALLAAARRRFRI